MKIEDFYSIFVHTLQTNYAIEVESNFDSLMIVAGIRC